MPLMMLENPMTVLMLKRCYSLTLWMFIIVIGAQAQPCDLTNPGLGLAECNDNGTPGDPSDDFYIFPLDPQGSGLGSGYTVTPSNGTLTPPGGNYGGPTFFTLSGVPPGSGVSLIVTDNSDPNCTTNTIINPPPCPNPPSCNINFQQVGNITCNDNGTPNDPSDDTFTFLVVVTGMGVSNSGWTANDPLNTTGQYDDLTTMGPYPISGGGFPLVATDNDDPNCTTNTINIVPPAPCSVPQPCNITDSGLNNISCVNAGTPNDPSDDFAQFTLDPEGMNLGTNYSVSISPGSITPTQGNYGSPNSFITNPGIAGQGDFTLTITDLDDPNCTLTFTLVNPCSSLCAISAVADTPICDDNGTPADPSDDTFTFNVTVSGSGNGNSWSANDPNGTTGNYDTPVLFGPYLISAGPLFITITDINDPDCIATFIVSPPPSCSNVCNLQSANLVNVSCMDNGTPFDPGDDFIEFTLNPVGQNTGSVYTVTPSSGSVTPNSANYGGPTVFQTNPGSAGNGPVLLTITDANDPGCSITITLPDPGVCSFPCNITPIIQNVECQNNGTPADPADDLFTAAILVNGNGSGWSANDPAGSTGQFGQVVVLGPYLIANGPVQVTFTSLDDPNCQQTITINPPLPCSDDCILEATVDNIICNDNGTPGNSGDDFFTATLLVTGLNAGFSWTAGQPANVSGAYDVPVNIGPFSTAQPSISFGVSDQDDPDCNTLITILSPGGCSSGCQVADTTLFNFSTCNPQDTGTLQVLLTNQFGCDSLIITTISLLPSDTTLLTAQSCNPSDTGTVQVLLTNLSGCDSLVITSTSLLLSDTTLLSVQSCNPLDTGTVQVLLTNLSGCDSLVITTTSFLQSDTTLLTGQSCNPLDTGTVQVLLTNLSGCDSLVITTTSFLQSDTTLLTAQSCNPLDTGTVQVLLTNQSGCDSLVITTTSFLQSDTTLLTGQSCNPLDTGTVQVLLTNLSGCDSLVITTTSFLQSDTTLLSAQSCNPSDTGTVQVLLTNQSGCDSLVITTTSFLQSDTTLLSAQSCNPSDTGTVQVMLTNQSGCDSLVITTTSFLQSDTTLLSAQSCNPSDTGTVQVMLTNQSGCDSLVITTTSLLQSDTTLLTAQSCNPVDTGTVQVLLTNQSGCDSLVITTTSFLQSDTTLLSAQSCNPSDTGTVQVLLTNQSGCDSLVITTTSLLQSDTMLLTAQSCNPLDTGTVEVMLTNQFGCDSLVITTTSLLQNDTTLLTAQSCNPQDTGTVQVLLTNQFGCDSLVITTTSLLPFTSSTLTSTLCFGDSLEINGIVYNAVNPDGVDTLVGSNGCDSLVFVDLQFSQPLEFRLIDTVLCTGDQIVINGQVYDETLPGGTQLISGQNGCDSLQISINIEFSEVETDVLVRQPACEGLPGQILLQNIGGGIPPFSIELNGQNAQQVDSLPYILENLPSGNYSLQVSDAFGCTVQQSLTIPQGPAPVLELGTDITALLGDNITLEPEINFAYDSLIWTPQNAVSCQNCLNTNVISTENLTITLLAINQQGCRAEDNIRIYFDSGISYYVPNAFNPDEDGINDFFTIFADEQQVNRIGLLIIFDRWGNQVFMGENLTPGAAAQGWDGRYRGELMNTGVFVYYGELVLIDGTTIKVKGDVLLVR